MKHARVLIVDGDRRLRSQLYTRLLDLEVFSDSVSNGSEAFEYLRDRSYGLILLDLELGNDEAYKIIDSVRVLSPGERPMVLATAARDSEPTIDSDLVQIVMRKPLRLGDVAEMIRSCVGSAIGLITAGTPAASRLNGLHFMPRVDERSHRAIDLLAGDEHVIGVVR